jgi:hypothetical protein
MHELAYVAFGAYALVAFVFTLIFFAANGRSKTQWCLTHGALWPSTVWLIITDLWHISQGQRDKIRRVLRSWHGSIHHLFVVGPQRRLKKALQRHSAFQSQRLRELVIELRRLPIVSDGRETRGGGWCSNKNLERKTIWETADWIEWNEHNYRVRVKHYYDGGLFLDKLSDRFRISYSIWYRVDESWYVEYKFYEGD